MIGIRKILMRGRLILFLVMLVSVVAVSGQFCQLNVNAKNTKDFLDEIPSLNSQVVTCPVPLNKALSLMLGNGLSAVNIKMNDGTIEGFNVLIKNKEIVEFSREKKFGRYLITTDEQSVDSILQNNNQLGIVASFYLSGRITIKATKFWTRVRWFFVKPFVKLGMKRVQVPVASPAVGSSGQIGPYNDMWACEFYQIPAPGVNKKYVSCPYETPGAAANDAHNAYCRTVMASNFARAEVCNEQGLIVCVHPCETSPAHIIPQRCAFDNDRPRGNQAPPLKWCKTRVENVPAPAATGKPDNCDETYVPGHQGYAQNKALWDRYTAETNGVCQSQYGRGVPGPCVYTVQLSVSGNPYYLCWYN